MTLALILLSLSTVFFWWKWVATEDMLFDLRDEFAKYIAEADQRFLRTRDGRKQAMSPQQVDECFSERMGKSSGT